MPTTAVAKELLERLFRDHPTKQFAVRLWDGTEISWGSKRDFTLIFRSEAVFSRLVRSADVAAFGDAYVKNEVAFEGDIEAAIALARYLRTVKIPGREKLRFVLKMGGSGKHTRSDDTRDVQAHYDLSNDFYRLFLDKRMVYSCAYFRTPECTLDQAQEEKLDLICRKLRLQKDEMFLDVGCGWGALVIWAVQHYGVRAHGITLSQKQFELATEQVRAAGLSDRITIEQRHYLDLPANQFDKIASIGMYEHVGIKKYPAYFTALQNALKSGGLLLNHGITVRRSTDERVGGDFISKYIFPGGELDNVPHTQVVMEECGFEILDVETWRRHYARTLREWYRRLHEREAEAAKYVPTEILRAWRLYLLGFALSFDENVLNIYQVLAAKNDPTGNAHVPMTREDVYRK
ncbi:class I SAM-dependent methyltransferase [Patescibacteria group bacterium]|nr:class I SAM-dependent methyltransferase [Patescibacteria group bacterium]